MFARGTAVGGFDAVPLSLSLSLAVVVLPAVDTAVGSAVIVVVAVGAVVVTALSQLPFLTLSHSRVFTVVAFLRSGMYRQDEHENDEQSQPLPARKRRECGGRCGGEGGRKRSRRVT